MKCYSICRVQATPDWNAVDRLPIDRLLWTEQSDVTAFGQICYDDAALYVRLVAEEQDIRAEHRGVLDQPCEDSCLEFFFCPVEGDLRYFNIEFNPNACLFLGIGTGIGDLTRLLVDDPDALFQPRVTLFDGGWAIEYRVPFSFVRRFFPGFAPAKGTRIRGNLYKCGDLTKHPHYLAWNDVQSETPAFHRPADFGEMVFNTNSKL